MRITQYFPAYIDQPRRETVEFNTLDELLAIAWVAFYNRPGAVFCTSGDTPISHLMVDYDTPNGEWHVIGMIPAEDMLMLNLPDWIHGDREELHA